MDVFKKMLEAMLELVALAEEYGEAEVDNMPYMLKCEVSYIRYVLEDVDQRMKKDHDGYEETT